MNIKVEYILCAAIWYLNGDNIVHNNGATNITKGLVITGYRHCHCFSMLSLIYPDQRHLKDENRLTQGFLTSKNRFVDRKEGAEIAIKANQVNEDMRLNDCLMSEDLYLIHDPIKG